MNEFVERLACAAFASEYPGEGNPRAVVTCGPRNQVGHPQWRILEPTIRATLGEAQSPTEHMVRAGVCVLQEKRGANGHAYAADLELVEQIFRAMVEEALR